MNRVTIEGDLIEVSLRQLGATNIEDIGSVMYLVEFELTKEMTLSYVYNITRKEKYYLQRIKPYPISRMRFADEREIVSYITKDVQRFKNAANSTNFEKLLKLNNQLSAVVDNLEELFLNYNVSKETLGLLEEQLETVVGTMDAVRIKAKQIGEQSNESDG